jgi:hypothetical protein
MRYCDMLSNSSRISFDTTSRPTHVIAGRGVHFGGSVRERCTMGTPLDQERAAHEATTDGEISRWAKQSTPKTMVPKTDCRRSLLEAKEKGCGVGRNLHIIGVPF